MSVIERLIHDRETWLIEWRPQNINASESSALWGVHPWLSPYKLWAKRSGLIGEDPDTPEKKRGRLFEEVGIKILRQEHPDWRIEIPRVYLFDPEKRIGATPDVYAWRDGKKGVVQIKTSGHHAFRAHWRDKETNEIEPPMWIAVQVTQEALLAKAEWGWVAAMTMGDGGIGWHEEEIPLRPLLIPQLIERTADFWRRVAQNDPYPVDWKGDAETVLKVFAEAADGSTKNMTGNKPFGLLLETRARLSAIESSGRKAQEERKVINARILEMMGNAWAARYGPDLVIAKTIRPKPYTVEPDPYRRIIYKKGAA